MALEIGRGTNISHWLSQSQARGEERRSRFTASDAERIAAWGFDHVRLPIDEEQLWNESGGLQDEAVELLQLGIDWCRSAGLKVIVDLHIIRSHYFNDDKVPTLFTDDLARARFGSLWADLSGLLVGHPNDVVGYELLNEAVAPTPAAWNRTWESAYDAIRQREPERTIVLGSNWFNQYQTFPDLHIPDDGQLILTYHYYNPLFITHYTAPWWRDGGGYSGPIRYPGKPIPESQLVALAGLMDEAEQFENRHFDREVMKADMSIPADIAREKGLRLYCGEFGCYEHTPEDIRRAWYRDILTTFDELEISWANWEYRGAFGLLDTDGNETGVASWLVSDR